MWLGFGSPARLARVARARGCGASPRVRGNVRVRVGVRLRVRVRVRVGVRDRF